METLILHDGDVRIMPANDICSLAEHYYYGQITFVAGRHHVGCAGMRL